MSDKPKVPAEESAVEKWNHAVREAYADSSAGAGVDAGPELSDEEVERQLVAAGVDLAAEDAKAAATYDAVVAMLERQSASVAGDHDEEEPRSNVAWVASTATPSAATPPAKRSRAVWIAYAIAAAIAVGGAAYVAGHQAPPPEPPMDTPIVHPTEPTPAPTVAPTAPAPEPQPSGPPKADKKAPR
jgi:hypothetical protein